ncbi:hypothetical protein ADUPG1_014337 [Aduncisulcus paluster]|uniref:Uncharacterized protein n=1 Tax=Aduncisulcus paluster TaxID=2918883 RepID=A0ABQ5KCD8_9EUKA|nr:hypothetical protein ADUPG1_014337 [Aduncisulcus paluster]|eukprot:gnl/Carplike_NY0171/1758_a2375_748.p1 GENE.gnl/Carplike_NY0171/1758_a2375_748~~gnl/Carplike_NY0171/1758_a2375_748.p1  ORF type:complete len:489 (+),score=105.11 gnl/Carplike_NY0171/1758_a2375_748:1-1467(+)
MEFFLNSYVRVVENPSGKYGFGTKGEVVPGMTGILKHVDTNSFIVEFNHLREWRCKPYDVVPCLVHKKTRAQRNSLYFIYAVGDFVRMLPTHPRSMITRADHTELEDEIAVIEKLHIDDKLIDVVFRKSGTKAQLAVDQVERVITSTFKGHEMLFGIGEHVRVRKGVSTPKYGWGSIGNGSVGRILSIESEKDLMIYYNRDHQWRGTVDELERVVVGRLEVVENRPALFTLKTQVRLKRHLLYKYKQLPRELGIVIGFSGMNDVVVQFEKPCDCSVLSLASPTSTTTSDDVEQPSITSVHTLSPSLLDVVTLVEGTPVCPGDIIYLKPNAPAFKDIDGISLEFSPETDGKYSSYLRALHNVRGGVYGRVQGFTSSGDIIFMCEHTQKLKLAPENFTTCPQLDIGSKVMIRPGFKPPEGISIRRPGVVKELFDMKDGDNARVSVRFDRKTVIVPAYKVQTFVSAVLEAPPPVSTRRGFCGCSAGFEDGE